MMTCDQPSITCPRCGMTSYHSKDIEFRYCGNCHKYHAEPPPPTPPPDRELQTLLCFECGQTCLDAQLVRLPGLARATRLILMPYQGATYRYEYSMPCGHRLAGWHYYDEDEGWSEPSYCRLDYYPPGKEPTDA